MYIRYDISSIDNPEASPFFTQEIFLGNTKIIHIKQPSLVLGECYPVTFRGR